MKKLFGTLGILLLAARLSAQSNAPVRLALITETDEAAAPSDVLTAQLSGNPKIQLLERNEIEKVYREQGLSAANLDYLKLGRILGADGLLLFDVLRTPQSTNLTARLIAVKPGVVLTDGSFPWPLTNTTQWAEAVVPGLDAYLPKLSVLAKDAIPISIVNLRAAVSSSEEQETERQLKLLTIQRLSLERQFFVLERQRMQWLGEEKELKSDESAFWDGSYLLEGVVDQNGYSKETVTISARLTPPKGGAPLLFDVSGSRTNLTEVINRLAAKVTELLKVNSTVKEWNATDEAAQYFDEAKWALRWGVYSEAQAAADSAWALGKRGLDCALVRVKSYILQITSDTGRFQEGEIDTYGSSDGGAYWIKRITSEAHVAVIYNRRANEIDYATIDTLPNPKNIDCALRALELYSEFSRTSSDGQPKILWRGVGWNDWHNSDWYNLGIEDLAAASKVLQCFNLVPQSQVPVADKLRDLRALTRSVAELISESPTVHDSYFVGDRIAPYDELAYTIGEEKPQNQSIFSCKVIWGCFWQETPEECIALYRELMSSPVFCYIHNKFWRRKPEFPRVVGWNEEDRIRIPEVWNKYLQELNDSTNVLLRMEGQSLAVIDAKNDEQLEQAFNGLMDEIITNRDELVGNNVDLFYLNWRVSDLLFPPGESYTQTPTLDRLESQCRTNFFPKLGAMHQEYRTKTVQAGQFLSTFEKQEQFLKENKPYDSLEFLNTFLIGGQNYSKTQALEIQPLLAAYKSNLVAQSKSASGMQKGKLMGAIAQVGFVEYNVDRILNPPASQPQPRQKIQVPKPAIVAEMPVVAPVFTNAPEVVTNVIVVGKFLAIPAERLIDLDSSERIEYMQVTITAHHWFEGRLLLDYGYYAGIQQLDTKGNVLGGRNASGPAIALLDPGSEHWDVVGCPEVDILAQNRFYHHTVLFRGELFTCDGGQLRKFDFQNRQWQALKISDGNNYELFAVNGHLYAANGNVIFEIVDGGKNTHILASNRRQPPVSALDTQDLGTPTLFEGPGHSLRVSTKNKIFTWTGDDWREVCAAPPASFPPIISADDVLFQSDGWNIQPARISRLATESSQVEFCLVKETQRVINAVGTGPVAPPNPLWKLPPELSLPNLSASVWQSSLYLMVDHSETNDIVNEQQHLIIGKKILPKDGYNAALFCFSHDSPLPQKVFFKFDASAGCPPTAGIGSDSRPIIPGIGLTEPWMLFTTNFLLCGRELLDSRAGNSELAGYKAGIWMIPLAQLASAIAAQKEILLQQSAQAVAATERAQKELLAKYDRNHNGILDPDEKEEALDDPAFIESELDVIDANHNGRLDPEELVYFDANQNKILDPKEQAGIDLAEHLFAVRLLKEFDANGDGVLDRSEFNDLWQAGNFRGNPPGTTSFSTFSRADANHDGRIDLNELEAFLKQQLRVELRPRGAAGAAFFKQRLADPNATGDPQRTFKTYVEFYWQHADNATIDFRINE